MIKTYNLKEKIRNLSKSTKIKIFGAALYTATSLFPLALYGNTDKTINQNPDSSSEYNLKKTYDLYQKYGDELANATKDGEIDHEEVKVLNDSLTKYLNSSDSLHNQIKKIENNFKGIDERLGKILEDSNPNNSDISLNKKDKLTIEELVFYLTRREEKILLKTYQTKLSTLKRCKEVYDEYINACEDWINGPGANKKFWSVAMISSSKKPGIPDATPIDDLEKVIEEQGYNYIRIKDLRKDFPLKTKLPLWLSMSFGLVAPFLRTLLVSKYTKRDIEGFDAAESVINGVGGVLFLDGLHPLVYPLRILVPPFIIEPIKKWGGY